MGCACRSPLAWLIAWVALCGPGVVSCGRLGFDEKIEQDASAIMVRPADATDLEVGDDAPATGDGAAMSDGTQAEDAAATCSPPCVNPNGTTACVNGQCAPVCSTGFADCDGNLSNGCEANVQADPAHCGSCIGLCTVDSGSATCRNGTCGTSSCAPGTADCDGDETNGCETAINTTSNCGMCGRVCTSDAGTPACSSGTCTTTCDLTGTWAGKVSLQVTWPGTLTLAAGSGTIGFWVIVKGTQSGNSIPVTMLPCGITVPDFQSSPAGGNEPYGLTFPNALFDHAPPYLPTVNTTVTLGGSSPGSMYSVPAVAFLVGLSMTNPTTDAWPSTPEMVTGVDMDQDTKAGVTVPYKSGGTYDLVPLNISKSARSDKAYLAARFASSFSGTIAAPGCTSITGTATVTHFDTHVIGCDVSGGGGDCNSTQSDFADSNKPAYAVGSATISLAKIANSATCSDVRGAL